MSTAAHKMPAALQARRVALEASLQPPNPDAGIQPSAPAEPQAPAPAAPAAPGIDPNLFAVSTDPDGAPSAPKPSPAAPPAPLQLVPQPGTDFEQQWRTAKGIIAAKDRELKANADEITTLKEGLAALQAKVGQLTTQPPAAPQAPAQAPTAALPQVPELTPAQLDQYKNSIPVIQRIVADALGAVIGPLMQRLAAVEAAAEQMPATQQAVSGLAQRSFLQALYVAVPDVDALTKTPSFVTFLSTTIPYSGGQTVQSRLRSAYEAEDVQTIVEIVKDYRQQSGLAQPPTAQPTSFSQPTTGGAAAPQPVATGAKPTLAWSKRVEAGRKYNQRLIPQAEFQQIEALYKTAIEEGRVDYNQ